MAGGLAPVLSPAYFSPQHPPSSKSSRIQNQAVCSLVTLFVFPKSYCGSCCFPPFGIHTVTNFLNRNTLGTAEGHCLPRYLGGGRACPAYRLYPACVSTQLQLAFNGSFSFMTGYCGRSAPAAVLTMYFTSALGFPLPQHCFMRFTDMFPYFLHRIGHRPVTGFVGLKSAGIVWGFRFFQLGPCLFLTEE